MGAAQRQPDICDIEVLGELHPSFAEILSPSALHFLARLERAFGARRERMLELRRIRQLEFDEGMRPDFLLETRELREADWTIGPLPRELSDRKVEITGPTDRKMVINALNSGARVYMADFEDSHSPTWKATIEGQINLRDAVRGEISHVSPEGKEYRLAPGSRRAVLMVRPRGWHLVEKHVLVDGRPISASLLDFGLFFFHNARELLQRGSGPYFYLPKMESHLEARLWNDVFKFAEDELGLSRGTIKATVLIETLPAAFEMDEILWELREHSAGLNCGRWDYIFSYIKKLRHSRDHVLPDRSRVTMEVPFLRAYSKLLVETCHRRGAHAMGGMAAQIPIRSDAAANDSAMKKVLADKRREVKAGHDGTWVAHPGLVELALGVFAAVDGPNQIRRAPTDERELGVAADQLLEAPSGPITEAGLRTNVRVSLHYLDSWLRGQGCVPLHHLMEDAATVEISRAQIWQWIRHPRGVLEDGRRVTLDLYLKILDEELEQTRRELGDLVYAGRRFEAASGILNQVVAEDRFADFITVPAYEYLE